MQVLTEAGGGQAQRAVPTASRWWRGWSQKPAPSHYQAQGAPQGFRSPHTGEVDRSEGAMGPWVGGRAAGPAAPPGLLTQQAASQPAFPQNTAVGAATCVVPTSHAELSSTRRKQVIDPLLFAHPQPMCPADARREPRQRPPPS